MAFLFDSDSSDNESQRVFEPTMDGEEEEIGLDMPCNHIVPYSNDPEVSQYLAMLFAIIPRSQFISQLTVCPHSQI